MKKLLLVTISLFFTFVAYAVTGLNPYAYNLSWEQSADKRTLNISYKLNADAKTVLIEILNEDGAEVLASFDGLTIEQETTPHTISINIAELITRNVPIGTDLKWRIKVTGTSPSAPKQVSKTYNFYCPQGVAVDNNPASPNFGKIFVTESLHGRSIASKNYYSKSPYGNGAGTIQAGIYVLSPNFTKITPNATPITGGNNFTQVATITGFDGGHQPYQICISEDSRIFVSSGDKRADCVIVWEIDKNNWNQWTPIIKGNSWNSNWQCLNNGNFFAGFNCSMDIKGSGNNLKLLLSSTTKAGAEGVEAAGYVVSEYAIGNQTTQYTGSRTNIAAFQGKYGVVYDKSNVIYDGEGGYWFGSSRGQDLASQPNLVHINQNGIETYKSSAFDLYGGAGLIIHQSSLGEKWIIKGINNGGKTDGKFKIWKPTYNSSTKKTTLTEKYTVTSTGLGRAHNAFAIDYAENLFVVGNHGERCIAFALPYNGTKTTPATSAINLKLPDENATYSVTLALSNDSYYNQEPMGTLSGGGAKLYGDQVTVTATATNKDAYEFVKWTNQNGTQVSTSANYTFNVTNNIILTAHFREIKYNVEYFNLFLNKEDITDYFKGDAATMDNKKNTRLWRLFQVTYNETYNCVNKDGGTVTQGGRPLEKVLYFVNSSDQEDNFETKRNRLEDFLDNDASPQAFYWLGQYLEHVVGQDINPTNNVNVWGFYLQSFINRTKTSWNQDISVNTDEGGNIVATYNVKSFAEAGLPDYWRKWWQQIDLGLDTTTTFQTAMRKSWNMRTPPQGSITTTNSGTLTPGNWYKWNNQEANPGKLLAWYYDDKNNPTWPTHPTIVRNVYKSGALFATWVEKLISEEKTIQNNSDAIWLLNYHNGTHDIKILRKMQGGMYNTLCLPFSATKAQQPSVLQNATIVQFTGVNENLYDESGEPVVELQFTKVDDIVAGVPYLVMPQTDITSEITFINIPTGYNGSTPLVMETAQEITKSTNNGSISFIGNIHPTNIPAQSLIVVANNRLAEVTEAGEIQHMRGYFRIDDAQLQTLSEEGKVYLSMRKPTTTSVPLAPEAEQPAQHKVRKIMHNGQIYILRGDEIYTLTGARVK